MEKEIFTNNVQQELLDLIRGPLSDEELSQRLNDYHDNDIAQCLELLNPTERKRLYHVLGLERMSDAFAYVEDVEPFFQEMDLEQGADVLEEMDADDAIDTLERLPEELKEQLVQRLDQDTKKDIDLINSYEEDEIGSQMTTNFILIQRGMTIPQATRALIEQAEDNDNISTIYVEDKHHQFYGAIELKDLIIARKYTDLETLIATSYPYVYAQEKIGDCIERLRSYSEDSIPVLGENNEILGVITAYDIVEVVDDEMGEDYARLAGLTAEADLNESLGESMKKRLPWLVALLGLGIVVSSVVGIFEGIVSQVALIVCFQSLILDMSGNVGTQSLAVTIRVLMDEALDGKKKALLALKEVRVGFCNGLLLGTISFLVVTAYILLFKGKDFGYSAGVAACVGVALTIAMTISSFVGTIIPMFFHKIKVDPAVASGPLITTVNDLVAVITYYGMAWFLLIQVMHITS